MSRLNYILSRHRTQSPKALFLIHCMLTLLILPLIWPDVGDLDPNYLQTLKAGGRERERERERGRERERLALAYESLLICVGAENDTWRCFSCASAFVRQSRIFDSIDALHAFYCMPKCLN